MKALAGIGLLVLLHTAPAAAVDNNGDYEPYAYDFLASCNGFDEHVLATDYDRLRTLRAWMRGYMTGFNQGKPGKKDFFEVANETDLNAWVFLWCQNNPSSTPQKGLLNYTNKRNLFDK